jgi:hypothetical protein
LLEQVEATIERTTEARVSLPFWYELKLKLKLKLKLIVSEIEKFGRAKNFDPV